MGSQELVTDTGSEIPVRKDIKRMQELLVAKCYELWEGGGRRREVEEGCNELGEGCNE